MNALKRPSSPTSFPTRREVILLTTLLVVLLLWPRGGRDESAVVVYGDEDYEAYFDQDETDVDPTFPPQDAQVSWATGDMPRTSIVQHEAGNDQ